MNTTDTKTKAKTKTAPAGAKRRAPAKPKAAKAGTQSAASAKPVETETKMSQGTGSASGELRGGTKQVLIEETKIEGRVGRRPGEEAYPFGALEPCRKERDGSLVGQSFFIPDTESPKQQVAAARKRHKPTGAVFLTRAWKQEDGDKIIPGIRVWRAPANA